jgi:hypothetical protein
MVLTSLPWIPNMTRRDAILSLSLQQLVREQTWRIQAENGFFAQERETAELNTNSHKNDPGTSAKGLKSPANPNFSPSVPLPRTQAVKVSKGPKARLRTEALGNPSLKTCANEFPRGNLKLAGVAEAVAIPVCWMNSAIPETILWLITTLCLAERTGGKVAQISRSPNGRTDRCIGKRGVWWSRASLESG